MQRIQSDRATQMLHVCVVHGRKEGWVGSMIFVIHQFHLGILEVFRTYTDLSKKYMYAYSCTILHMNFETLFLLRCTCMIW